MATVTIDAVRWERVRCIAAGAFDVEEEVGCPDTGVSGMVYLQTGDLEPIEPDPEPSVEEEG